MVHDVEIQAFAARADSLHLQAGVHKDPAGALGPGPGCVHRPGADFFFVFFEAHFPRSCAAQLIQQGLGIVDAIGAAAPTAWKGKHEGHDSIVYPGGIVEPRRHREGHVWCVGLHPV